MIVAADVSSYWIMIATNVTADRGVFSNFK